MFMYESLTKGPIPDFSCQVNTVDGFRAIFFEPTTSSSLLSTTFYYIVSSFL